jgi:hypothetical protein
MPSSGILRKYVFFVLFSRTLKFFCYKDSIVRKHHRDDYSLYIVDGVPVEKITKPYQ